MFFILKGEFYISYGIIRIAKYKKGCVKGLQIHDQREKDVSHTNKDIDFDKTYLNYDLHNAMNINFTEEVSRHIGKLNLKKAVRKDAVVMCQCLITSDNGFFKNMTYEKQQIFFKDSYDFICDRFGKQNIVSAIVHHDEYTPHIHINFIPVTSDGRLCAKDLFKKSDLVLLHDDFYKFNQLKGYNLKRGESKGEYQKHLTTEEFKIKMQKEFIEQESLKFEEAKNKLDKVKENIKSDEIYLSELKQNIDRKLKLATKILDEYDSFTVPLPEKVMFQNNKVKIDKNDYEKLMALADIAILKFNADDENKRLKEENKNLIRERNEFEKKSKTNLKQKLEINKNHISELNVLKKEIYGLKNENRNFQNLINYISSYLEENNIADNFNNFIKEKMKKIEQRNNQNFNMEV